MKNQYVGDINDYVKYALLRHLMRAGSEVTVCWMLTSDDGRPDGNRRGYLDKPEQYRHHDPELFDALAGDLRHVRDVKIIEESGILPDARFLSDLIEDLQEVRKAYFRRLLAALATRSLVFFDPDNGLDIATVRPGRRNSSKYLFREELAACLYAGHSAIVYQHFPRVERQHFVGSVFESVALPGRDLRSACVYTSHVAYLLFLQEPHTGVSETARAFAGGWAPMLSYLEPTRDDPVPASHPGTGLARP
jgi:hypothetical protein